MIILSQPVKRVSWIIISVLCFSGCAPHMSISSQTFGTTAPVHTKAALHFVTLDSEFPGNGSAGPYRQYIEEIFTQVFREVEILDDLSDVESVQAGIVIHLNFKAVSGRGFQIINTAEMTIQAVNGAELFSGSNSGTGFNWANTRNDHRNTAIDALQPLMLGLNQNPEIQGYLRQEQPTRYAAVFTKRETSLIPSTFPADSMTDWEEGPLLAILDFEGIGISDSEARVLSNRLGTQMVQIGRYQVIERGQMEQILQEQDFQMTGCTSDECAVEIGQLIGAQQMLAGSFGKLGDVYTIDMRIIDVETGRILRTTSFDVEGSIQRLLSEGLPNAVRRIVGMD